MTLQASGLITAEDINVELGRAASDPFSLGGVDERALAGVASGVISFSDFYGKSNALPIFHQTKWSTPTPGATWTDETSLKFLDNGSGDVYTIDPAGIPGSEAQIIEVDMISPIVGTGFNESIQVNLYGTGSATDLRDVFAYAPASPNTIFTAAIDTSTGGTGPLVGNINRIRFHQNFGNFEFTVKAVRVI